VIKVNEIAYLLEKINNQWRIRSSKQLNQHVLYNVQQIRDIYKKAFKYDSQKIEKGDKK